MIAVGDGGYLAKVMSKKMWEVHRTYILAPARRNQKQLMAEWQRRLLRKLDRRLSAHLTT